MRKVLIVVIILILITAFFAATKIYFLPQPPKKLDDLGLIILKNTKFKDLKINTLSFKYPDWQMIEIDPFLIWPKEIAEREEILLHLTNQDGVKILLTKRELNSEDLAKPYPLIFREILAKNKEIMEREGGLSELEILREEFFENGVLIESKHILFGNPIISISKSIILFDTGTIYSFGISAQEKIFEDYRPLANYILDSIRYY